MLVVPVVVVSSVVAMVSVGSVVNSAHVSVVLVDGCCICGACGACDCGGCPMCLGFLLLPVVVVMWVRVRCWSCC